MTTIRDLVAAGFDPDTEILMYRSDEDDVAYGTVFEVRHTDALNAATVLVISATDEYAVIADEDDDEAEWQAKNVESDAAYMARMRVDHWPPPSGASEWRVGRDHG